jgi:ATP-dependent Clp protease ATP-binding subunit ClpA
VCSSDLDDLNALVKDKNIQVKPTESTIEFLIEKGFDSKMGARPLQRAIDDLIKRPLSKEILFGRLTNGGIVEINAENKELTFNIIDVMPVLGKVKNVAVETDNI